MSQTISVSQLNRYVAALLDQDNNLRNVKVSGELSGFKAYASGHLYFTLKDNAASVSCVMFKGQAGKLNFKPDNGVKVTVTAKASLYDRDGRFQLYVQNMQPEGAGDLYLAFEQLKRELSEEGLFDASNKKPIPVLPGSIGVATSASGAVIRDIIHVLRRRFPGFNLKLIPVAVQGDQAARQIADAIKMFNQLNNVDVIIVGRGGGSMEDLWAFNEEIVARSVFASKIPVISAVGHETDFTICDFVADLRAPTPSAAAELAVPLRSDLLSALSSAEDKMKRSLLKRLQLSKLKLESLTQRPVMKSPLDRLNRERQNLDWLSQSLCDAHKGNFNKSAARISLLAARLDALSPLKVLSRGYAFVTDSNHRAIQSTAFVHRDDLVDVTLQDGVLGCRVEVIKDRRM